MEGLPGIILLTDVANKIEENKDYRGRITTSEIFAWVKENAVNSDFEEFVLPLQDVLYKEEDLNELKVLNLGEKSISRQVYQKMADPSQKELYEFPSEEDNKKENMTLERFFEHFFMNKTKDEL